MIKLKESKVVDNKELKSYLIEGDFVSAEIINYGARIHKLFVKDINGVSQDIVAGFDEMEGFMGDNPYFNATIGRVANRIGGGKFTLNGKEYTLYNNDNDINHLHGGKEGFDRKIFDSEIIEENGVQKLKFTYLSVDGEEGYPGNLQVEVKYSITNDSELNIEYLANTDADTLCSLTNHAYFNLSGNFDEGILDHYVKIKASGITLIDDGLIPDGAILNVKNTVFDFNEYKTIGQDINSNDPMLKICGGYDVNFVLKNDLTSSVAEAYSTKSKIKMEVYTVEPCMQLYTGNFLDGLKGKTTYYKNAAFCMETQGYPNACNVPSFKSMELKKGETYKTNTTYKFSLLKD